MLTKRDYFYLSILVCLTGGAFLAAYLICFIAFDLIQGRI